MIRKGVIACSIGLVKISRPFSSRSSFSPYALWSSLKWSEIRKKENPPAAAAVPPVRWRKCVIHKSRPVPSNRTKRKTNRIRNANGSPLSGWAVLHDWNTKAAIWEDVLSGELYPARYRRLPLRISKTCSAEKKSWQIFECLSGILYVYNKNSIDLSCLVSTYSGIISKASLQPIWK